MGGWGRVGPVAALPAAAVLAVDPGGLSPFGPAKWMVVPALVLAGAALLHGRRSLSIPHRPALAFAVFLVWVVVAAALGIDGLYAWVGTPERHFGAVTWVLCAVAFVLGSALDEAGRRRVVGMATVTVGLLGVWTAAEVAGLEPMDLVGAGSRPVGTMGSSAYLGAAAVLLAPVALGVALSRLHRRVVRRGAACAALAGLVALVASGARAAWVGAVVAGVVALALRRRAITSPPRLALAIAAAAAGAVGLAVVSGVAGRLPDAVSDRDGGARGRLDEWRVAGRVVTAAPVVGVGPEGYRIAFGSAVDDDYERAHGRDPLPDRAHSAPLDVAATTGIPGGIAYLALVLLVGGFMVRSLRRSPPWLAGAAAGVVGYAAQSLFLFPVAELEPVAWLLAGLIVGAVAHDAEKMMIGLPRRLPALAGVVAVVALVAGAFDVAADRAARSTLSGVGGDRPGDAGRAARLRPDALRYRLVAARALAAGGTPDSLAAAVAHLDRALAISPLDPVARSERARLLLDRARLTGEPADASAALASLEDLAGDDPRNAEALLRLGLARALAGDDAGAEWAWLAAERLAPASAAASVNLAVAYARAERRDDARAAARRALARDPDEPRALAVLDATDGT